MHRIHLPLLASLLMGLAPAPALAGPPVGQDAPSLLSYEPPPVERRGGFTLGASAGFGVGHFSGYPNVAGQLGNPAYQSTTGIAFDQSLSIWLGGALRDWLTFGVGAALASGSGDRAGGSVSSAVVHLDAYPLYWLKGRYRDLGLAFEGGLGGGMLLSPAQPLKPLADGGLVSHVGVAAFYEPWRVWHLASGPVVSYTYDFSQTLQAHQLLLGFRVAFYGLLPHGGAQRDSTARLARAPSAAW